MKRKLKRVLSFPYDEKDRIVELPGLALSSGSYDGFGKSLAVSVEDDGEEFGEDKDDDTE